MKFYYGGQAVLEGVMMRGRRSWAVAVRAPDGKIVVKEEQLTGAVYGAGVRKIPFLRGIALLWETLNLGMQALMFSANVALAEEDVEMTKPMMAGTVLASLAFAIGLFFVLPVLAVGVVDRHIESSFASNLAEGAIRLLIFVGYLAVIGMMPDIRRVFGYHGAEHMTINGYEAGAYLDKSELAAYTRAHPRCGTTFLFEVLVLSIFVFALLGRPPMVVRLISRIVLVPVIASVSYEILRLGAGAYANRIVQMLLSPFLALQTLTTRKPDESMLEVAIVALKSVLATDGVIEAEPDVPVELKPTPASPAPA
jgi:uncharacterized protein YqhQ